MADGRPALDGAVIVELKFRAALPAMFKGLLVVLGLGPRPTSKYRLGMTALNGIASLSSREMG